MRTHRLALAAAAAFGVGAALLPGEADAAPTPGNELPRKGGNTGLGISIGDPMGLSLKHFVHPNHAIQFHVAWLPLHLLDGGVEFDYLWTPGVFVRGTTVDFMPYLGLGVGIGFDAHHAGLMIKPPLGLALHWRNVPLDTCLEGTWSPYWLYGPPVGWEPKAGDISLKIRYYFGR